MNFGFNSNVDVGGKRYHVQSEDHGPTHLFFDTVVYQAGRVVHKRRIGYEYPEEVPATAIDDPSRSAQEMVAERLHEWLAAQHRDVIAQLEAGALNLNPSAYPAILHVQLLNPQTWLNQGHANLEVQIQHPEGAARGAMSVAVFVESGEERSQHGRATADPSGRAALSFPVTGIADGAMLVIQASDTDAHGELRFRLHARRKNPADPSSK